MSKAPEVASVENYLQQIERELRALPTSARADELREIEAHLRALVLAGQQIEEISEAEATTAALKQFGAPKRVGRNLRKAWERKQPEAWWRAVLAFIVIELAFYVAVTPLFEGFAAFSAVSPMSLPTSSVLFWCFTLPIVSVIPVITGCFVGIISPKYGQLVALVTSILLTLVWLIPYSELYRLEFYASFSLFLLYISTLFSIMLGVHFGAQYLRKRQSRIAN